jgi:hypothetical protein
VDGGADLNSALGREAGGKAHHFCAVGLHRKIPQASRVRCLANAHMPPEDGV